MDAVKVPFAIEDDHINLSWDVFWWLKNTSVHKAHYALRVS